MNEFTRKAMELADEYAAVSYLNEITTVARAALLAHLEGGEQKWLPIETAPKDGRTVLLGYFNSHGKWRTLRGQWFSREIIDDEWENAEDCKEGWYETSVECDSDYSVWKTEPTHWQPLPATPTEEAP